MSRPFPLRNSSGVLWSEIAPPRRVAEPWTPPARPSALSIIVAGLRSRNAFVIPLMVVFAGCGAVLIGVM